MVPRFFGDRVKLDTAKVERSEENLRESGLNGCLAAILNWIVIGALALVMFGFVFNLWARVNRIERVMHLKPCSVRMSQNGGIPSVTCQ